MLLFLCCIHSAKASIMTKQFTLSAAFALLLAMASCTQQTVLSGLSTQAIQDKVVTADGVWRIAAFTDDGKDYTNQLSGWSFTFSADGNIVANDNAGNTYNGNWFISNDDTPAHRDFVITIAGTSVLLEMSDDWTMQEVSDTRMVLFDDDKGIRTEELVFER